MAGPFIVPHPPNLVSSLGNGKHTHPTPREGLTLCMASSKEDDVEVIKEVETADLPPNFIQYKELLEVVTRAVDKLKINWQKSERP